ncbi:MAG: GGDEF domain-containing protein, partial [Proteobacteria bacterium]|nr:GGDEF domain-containing protein [Pseudomonadota bacterium]
DALLEVDGGFDVRYASGATNSLFGETEPDLVDRPLVALLIAHDRGLVLRLLRGLAEYARLEPVLVQINRTAEDPLPVVLTGYRMDGRYYLTLVKARPSHADLFMAGQRDAETGLLEKDAFAKVLGQRLGAAKRLDTPSKLTLLKLDEIQSLKDNIGTANTERLMAELGALLRVHAIDGTAAGRLADDRYGVLHQAALDGQEIKRQIEALGRAADPNGRGFGVDGSTIDVPVDGLNQQDTTRVLLYTIQKFSAAGGQPFIIHTLSEGLKEMLADTAARVAKLKDTVAGKKIAIALQPIVALATRNLHHYEALSRMPDGASPAETIGFAEKIGMAAELDLMVCQRVLEFLLSARDNSQSPKIAVNISAPSLESEIFVGAFRALLAPHPELRQRLVIEVTESTQIKDLVAAENVLARLRRDGHRVCLDDFGSGAASFQYIQALTIDFVKIDGAYVQRVMDSARDEAILKAMVGLCRELRIGTIAEMIETEEQARRLYDLGVTFGQGYLFGRPTVGPTGDRPAERGARRRNTAEVSA